MGEPAELLKGRHIFSLPARRILCRLGGVKAVKARSFSSSRSNPSSVNQLLPDVLTVVFYVVSVTE